MENRISANPLAIIPGAPACPIASRSAGAVCGWLILLAAMTAMEGCGYEGNPAQGPTAGRTGNDSAAQATYWKGDRDALRVRTDTARNRLWVLGVDNVRIYDIAKKRLIRQIELPNWSIARFVCMPDMALDRSGSAIISSNVQARLWQINADSFEVKEQEISLLGRERWDIGFGALAFTADGTLLGVTSSAGSLWRFDVGKRSARMVKMDASLLNVCELTAQFLNDFERNRKP